MSALAHWKPQPIIPQPIVTSIRRQYQLARLHEQLQTATNGGRVNIFKVVGYGAQRLPEGHPGLLMMDATAAASVVDDATGEPETAVLAGSDFSRRSSSFSISAGPRRPSITSRA